LNIDKLRETLERIQANVPERKANLISTETAIIDELKGHRSPLKGRHFLKFDFGHKEACATQRSTHPEPEMGAAIMVCDRFRPQWQAILILIRSLPYRYPELGTVPPSPSAAGRRGDGSTGELPRRPVRG